jgi:hypothetical protein
MSAVDADTLRQVSTAALIGLDARALLTTDEPAVHVVYGKVIDQAVDWWRQREQHLRRNRAVEIVNAFSDALKKKG